ncbi:hypothetical protein ACLMJK_008265 [Lecanora helva]
MDNDTEEKDFAAGGGSTYSPHDSPQNATFSEHQNVRKGHQRLVFTDPAAFRYLEEDPSTIVLERRRRLSGYELYVVEQWACSRVHPTFVITTYTGLEQHSVIVGVLSVPTDEDAWSPRLRVYLKAITKYHARKKETPLGIMMVTNLSGFPSALTIVAVPDGDLKKHREDFIVNENLKRLGCSGRTGLSLSTPVGATQAKFNSLYHISDRIPIYNAVIEMVKLCQVALMLFDKLAPEYADGLLCDVTEQAINDWWAEIGAEYFNVDPSDGILGPTTVAAMLGLLMGARNRLNAYGAPVAKDVFDIVSTKRAIGHFQKSQKLEKRSRRLDLVTLNRIHRVTAKAASGEGWVVPRAVKSTVAELKGKGSNMVNGRETAGIAAVETLDMETFVQLGSGERFKWLWYGKPRKNTNNDMFNSPAGDDGMLFHDIPDGGTQPGENMDTPDDEASLRHVLSDPAYLHSSASQTSLDHSEKDQALRRAVLKNMTGKVTDARSGFGRIRDAVGFRSHRSHQSRHSREMNVVFDRDIKKNQDEVGLEDARDSDIAVDDSQHASTPPESGEQSMAGSVQSSRRGSNLPALPLYGPDERRFGEPTTNLEASDDIDYEQFMKNAPGVRPRVEGREVADESRSGSLSMGDARAIFKMQSSDRKEHYIPPLRTTQSLPKLSPEKNKHWEHRWPRSLSFTTMVDVLAASVPDDLTNHKNNNTTSQPPTSSTTALATQNSLLAHSRTTATHLSSLTTTISPWVTTTLHRVESYDHALSRDNASLDLLYHQHLDAYTSLSSALEELLAEEKAGLGEGGRGLETLGQRVEYELVALEGKVADVEEGVREFERRVKGVEGRVGEVEVVGGGEEGGRGCGWVEWVVGKVGF